MKNICVNSKFEKDEITFIDRKKVISLYRKGSSLGILCRTFYLDISSILHILGKSRLKRKTLYKVYENQNSNSDASYTGLILERDKHYLDKFFPNSSTVNFSSGYHWFWRENLKKNQTRKDSCKHKTRHIRCGHCNKILKDATNIPIDDIITYKYDQNRHKNNI